MRKIFYLFLLFFFFSLIVSGYAQKDKTPPQVTIINPKNGQVVSDTVKIQVKATDNVGVLKVEYYIDGKKVGENTKSPYEYNWDTTQYENGNHTIQVKAYDKAGNVGNAKITVNVQNIKQNVWEKTFGGSDDDYAYSIQQTSDGGYIVAGRTSSFGAGSADVYIIKLDENGNKLWEKTFGGSSYDWANSIQQTTDGGYIVAGVTNSFGAGGWDVYVIKLDENGNLYSVNTIEEKVESVMKTLQKALEKYSIKNYGNYTNDLLDLLDYLPDNQFPKHPLTKKPYEIGINLFDPVNEGSPVKNSSDARYQYAIVYEYDDSNNTYTLIGYDQTNTKVIFTLSNR